MSDNRETALPDPVHTEGIAELPGTDMPVYRAGRPAGED